MTLAIKFYRFSINMAIFGYILYNFIISVFFSKMKREKVKQQKQTKQYKKKCNLYTHACCPLHRCDGALIIPQ